MVSMQIVNISIDIRDELKAANDSVSSRSTPFRIAIPSLNSLNEFWPESKQFVAVPHDLQRTIVSPISAMYIGLNLLMALCASARPRSRRDAGSALFEQQYPWILDTCEEFWHYFRRWTTSSDRGPLHDETIMLYMQLMDTLTIPSSEPRNLFSNLSKAASASVSSVARLIETLATSSMSDGNQIQLALMVTRLCHVAQIETRQGSVFDRRRRPSHVSDTESLKQSARRICENTEVFFALQKDLQVSRAEYHVLYATNER